MTPNVMIVTGTRNRYPTVEAVRQTFPFHNVHHNTMRSFPLNDYSSCFVNTDLLWFEWPHRWLPKQFVPNNKMFDAVLKFQQGPIVFVLHKPRSSPLLRNNWFKDCMGSLNLSQCCTCCFGANTHCLVFMYTRGLTCEDRICQDTVNKVPASIISDADEIVVWKLFVENWLMTYGPGLFHPSENHVEHEDDYGEGPPGLEFMRRVMPKHEVFAPLLGKGSTSAAHNPAVGQPVEVGKSLWAQQVPDSLPLVVAPTCTDSNTQGQSSSNSSVQPMCQYYLGDTKVMCSMLTQHTTVLKPVKDEPNLFDIYPLGGQTLYARRPSMILTGMSFDIPEGFVGLVTDAGAESQSHLTVIRSILDHNTSREMCLLVENSSGHSILVKPNVPLARVCF